MTTKATPNTTNKMKGTWAPHGIPTPMRPGSEDALLVPSLDASGNRVPRRGPPMSMAASPKPKAATVPLSGPKPSTGIDGMTVGQLCGRNGLSKINLTGPSK